MKQRIAIIGAGESGVGAAVLAKIQGFDVFVSDFREIAKKYKDLLYKYGVDFEENGHTEDFVLNADEVIKSPGVPDKAPIIATIKQKGIRIISEIEFAGRYTTAKKICITGSNGKTTTALLIHHMMKKAGLNAGIAGNIGKSFALQVAEDNYDYYVIELSSFQLDGMYDFKADVAILLNITPDHLDRYDYELLKYVESKFRITQNLSKDDFFIYCSDDEITIKELEKIVLRAKKLPFSIKKMKNQAAYIENNTLKIKFDDINYSQPVKELALTGKHNTYNSMAAGIAGNIMKLRKRIIKESLNDFQGIEHRLEKVLKIHGVEFINDSKATNINSTWYALESITGQIIWIAGGIDKGNDYSQLEDIIRKKVKVIICLGNDNSKIHRALEGIPVTIVDTTSIEEAVNMAYYLSKKGDTVLLSPACASYDLFENYEDRGRQFKDYVRNIKISGRGYNNLGGYHFTARLYTHGK
uniref:UDP-N-acetylmuramoylalanine--D-glutamate ligase n=1 Tax=Candidatus Methanophaga sp. ANME-1 ERB7 TaxID=2759913 RepID=A0A7G9Z7G3_9EURY|nr:UDP-N-acetylmuramoylalanine--D-glutamate ligase [Methanosarcinales archaeon ANME-1 ERB7]